MNRFNKYYADLKENRTRATLLFRFGEFYEAYYDDAETLSHVNGKKLGVC